MKTGEKLYFSRAVEIDINTSCNRRCLYCPNSIYDRGLVENEKLMPTGLFHKIIDELAEIGYNGRISPVFYGEPLLDKRIVDLMRYVRNKLPKSRIVMFTNGDFLTHTKYSELVQAGVDEFIITQHGQDIPDGVKDLYKYCESNECDLNRISYQKFSPGSELLSNRGGLIHLSVVYSIPICAYDWITRIVINYEGDVILCCNDYFSEVKFGNIRENKLIEIWMDKTYRSIREDLRNQRYTLPICVKCLENYDPIKTKEKIIDAKIKSLEKYANDYHDSIDLKTLSDIPLSTAFNVEDTKFYDRIYLLEGPAGISHEVEKILVIKGWAIDSSACSPASAVFVTFDTGQEYRAYYSLQRPDVAKHFDRKNLKDTGFVFNIPLDDLSPDSSSFRLKIVSQDRKGYYHPPEQFSFRAGQ